MYYLVPGSVADDSKLIHPGDCILEANGHDLRQASVDDAANYMSVSEPMVHQDGWGDERRRGRRGFRRWVGEMVGEMGMTSILMISLLPNAQLFNRRRE